MPSDEDTVLVFAAFRAAPFAIKAWLYQSPLWQVPASPL